MARKKTTNQLTPLELEIMMVLWESGTASVQDVQQRLPKERDLAYSTVQTMLNLLVRKGKVRRNLIGRAYCYMPVLERSSAVHIALKDIIDRLFGGSAENMVMGLVETHQIEPETLVKLNRMLKRGKRARNAGS